MSSRCAWVVSAFVDVRTAQVGVARVARLAHALGRIARRTLGVDTAGVALAWALTFVPVLCIRVVRRRADALARLDATLVHSAFGVCNAADLSGKGRKTNQE